MSSEFRKEFLLQMHLSRALLLQAMVGMTADQMEQPIWDDYSTRRLLPHIALWEGFEADRLQLFIDGRLNEIQWTPVDERNAAWHTASAETTIDGGIAMLQKERNGLLNVIANAPDELLKSTVKVGEIELNVMSAISSSIEHDEDHTKDIRQWRAANDAEKTAEGNASVLIAYLRATRNAMKAVMDLVGDSGITIDRWTPKDILAHLGGWEAHALKGLHNNEAPPDKDSEQYNDRFALEAADNSVDDVWKTYANSRKAVINYVEKLSPTQLAQDFPNEYSWHNSPYKWVCIYPNHDLEHVQEMYTAWLIKKRVKKSK